MIGDRAHLSEVGEILGGSERRWRWKTQLALRREEEGSRAEAATSGFHTAAHPAARADKRSGWWRLNKIVGRSPREHRRSNSATDGLTRREIRVALGAGRRFGPLCFELRVERVRIERIELLEYDYRRTCCCAGERGT